MSRLSRSRAHEKWTRLSHRYLAPVVVLVVSTSLVGAISPPPAQAATNHLAAPAKTAPIPHKNVAVKKAVPYHPPASVVRTATAWPAAGDADVTLSAPAQPSNSAKNNAQADTPQNPTNKAGQLPILLGNAAPAAASDQTAKTGSSLAVHVHVADQATTRKAGVTGVLFSVAPSTPGANNIVSIGLAYSAFRDAVGADWASRLHIVELPTCALTTPNVRSCQTQTPVAGSTNDAKASVVSATVPLVSPANTTPKGNTGGESAQQSGNGTLVLAAVAGADGPNGTFQAGPLKPSGSWSVSGASGDFSWSYPIAVPPAASGDLAPQIALSYDSQAVDGETAGTNTQPSWIGDGWDYEPGFIERSYRGCADDTTLTADEQTGDECWAGQVLTMSLNGATTQLVDDNNSDTNWHTQSDTGDEVQHLHGANNGAQQGEYWEITSADGTHYFFGKESGPGHTDQDLTNSTWTEPVRGAHPNDPCYNATFANDMCTQAYRWNLDYVEDAHGNVTMYYYTPETNYYTPGVSKTSGDPNAKPVSYIRGGTLAKIEYGLRDENGSVYGSQAPDQVVFTTTQRCTPTADFNCDASQFTTANAKFWPDTPQDQQCLAGSQCANYSPTFWTTQRLTNILTEYANGSGGWTKVDSYDLAEHFPDDSSDGALQLDSVTRTGFAADGTSLALPPVTFKGHLLDNRVDGYASSQRMARYRVTQITAETGQDTLVTYSDPQCTATNVPSAPSNDAMLCYPVNWTQPGATAETHDYFHKYVTRQVEVVDPNALSPSQVTQYNYQGDPAWHFDDGELTKPADRTYDQFRGYSEVDVLFGNTAIVSNGAPDQQTLTKTFYFRGMDGDTLPSGTASAPVTNSLGETVPDNDLFADNPYEVQTYNGANGAMLSKELTNYEVVATTASRPRTGLSPLTANVVTTAKVRGFTEVAAGGAQTSTTTYGYDTLGRTVQETDSADGQPDICTTTKYAGNLTAGVRNKADESIVSQEACSAQSPTPSLILSDNVTYYDGSSTEGEITNGDVTRGDSAVANDNGQLSFATTTTATFDTSGRPLSTTDYDTSDPKSGNTTALAYTPADGGNLTTTVTTNAKGQTSSLTVDPGRNTTTHAVDVAGHVTDATYDPLGRITAEWLPGHDKNSGAPASSTYSYLLQPNGPQAVTTKTLIDRGLTLDGSPSLDYTTSIQLYDSFGQLLQTQADAEGNTTGRTVSDTFYDSHGWTVLTNNRYTTDGAPSTSLVNVAPKDVNSRTATTYDGAGRAIEATNYNGLTQTDSSQTIYGGDRVTTIPPQGGVTATVLTDARGHDTELRQYTTPPTVSGNVVTGGTYNTTAYGYNALGKNNKITDADGNVWTSTYDMLGRLIQNNDPSTGQATYSYDLSGNLLTSTDARGQTLAYGYDELNRKTAEHSGSISGPLLASWIYDASQTGKLYESIRYTPQGQFAVGVDVYDSQGNPNKYFTQIPDAIPGLGGEYDTIYSYTSTNLVSNVEPADGGGLPSEDIANSYDPLGNLNDSHGTNEYLGDATYTPYGEPEQYIYGPKTNGVASLNFGYDPQTRRISDVTFNANQANPQLDDTKYSYDPAGNLTRTTDVQGPTGSPTQTTCDSYDSLDRLAAAWTATDNCANPPTTAAGQSNIGGTDPYWESWKIDPTGLRSSQVQHALPGATGGDITTTYTYPGAGQSQPDSLLSTSTTGPTGTASTSYSYDADGNTATRTLPTGQQTLTWDQENHLATDATKTVGTSTFTYDADGNELLAQDPNSTTLYLPGEELTYTNATKAVTGTRYYTVNGQTVAVRVGGADPDYLDGDQHGTMQTVYDPTKKAVTRRTLDPYGNQVGQDITTSSTGATSQGSWPDQHGFLNDPVDSSTGLTDIGARQYDTTTGRFISVDPELNPGDPQSMSGYAYADNDPVSSSDPTGLRPDCDGDKTCMQNFVNSQHSPAVEAAQARVAADRLAEYNAQQGAIAKVGSGKVNDAQKTLHTSIVDVILKVGGDFLKGLLGIDDMEKCFGQGNVGSCATLLLSVLPFDRIIEEGVNLVKFVVRAIDAVRDFVKATEDAEHVMEEVSDAEQAITDADKAVQSVDDAATSGVDDSGGGGGDGSDDASPESDPGSSSESDSGESEGDSCTFNSFAGATQVLMADGTTKAIETIKVGDKVENADPDSSTVQQHTVTAVHVTYTDRDFDDLTVSTSAGSETITVTAAHLIWDVTTQQWTEAGDLKLGDQLDTPGDGHATVEASRHYTASITTYNLSIDNVHTYYVDAGLTPVLVHNCPASNKPDADQLSESANGQAKRGVSPASRAYQKHMKRPNTSLIPLSSGKDQLDMSEYLIHDLLTSPRTAVQTWNHSQFGPVIDLQLPDIGARWSQAGDFIGFLD